MINKAAYGFISVPCVILIGLAAVRYRVPLAGVGLIVIFMLAMEAMSRQRRH